MGMYYGTCIYCGKYCFKNDEYVKPKGNRKTIWFHRKCYEAEQAEIRENVIGGLKMRIDCKELEENINNVEYVYKFGINTVPLETCILFLSKALLYILRNMEGDDEL